MVCRYSAWVVLGLVSLLTSDTMAQDNISTREDRAALAELLITKTLEREAFSEIKNRNLQVDIERDMRHVAKDVADASDEIEFYFALVRLSNARRDRHLLVRPAPGGPSPLTAFRDLNNEIGQMHRPRVALEFQVSFAEEKAPVFFVSNVGKTIRDVQRGDIVTRIGSRSFQEFLVFAEPYCRFSTRANFLVRLAEVLPNVSLVFPPSFYDHRGLTLTLQRDGKIVEVTLPYVDSSSIEWMHAETQQYPGFRLFKKHESFRIYIPEDDSEKIILLQWQMFGNDLRASTDALVELAEQENWLEHDLIVDCTRSGGGSQGAYALQRLTPRSFRTTFGNLRISDVTQEFVDNLVGSYRRRNELTGGAMRTREEGGWLVDWLTDDVVNGIAAKQLYSNNVPFKCAHAPKDSDGLLHTAKKHFSGRMVCWFSPYGGSQLDQFASMVADNDLAYTIGMPTGGYSNTWEWNETVAFPISHKPAIRFMWSIGHTIRPNGEVLEGNPADVDLRFPLTLANHETHYALLLEESRKYLRSGKN